MESMYGAELDMFRTSVRRFFREEIEPNVKAFEANGIGRDIWRKAGAAGLLGAAIPEQYGGAGADRLAIVICYEEQAYSRAGASIGSFLGTDLQTVLLIDHGTEQQKQRWFPTILTGETILATAMTEPGAGSDATAIRTTALRDGDEYVINGSKCFISNGNKADLIFVIAKTDPAAKARGMSVIMVPGDVPGLTRHRMKGMGYAAGDTGELFFDNVRVPVANLLGEEGAALGMFHSLMALDRLQISGYSLGAAQLAFELTLDYVRQRQIFGKRVVDFQNTQFKLAEMEVELELGRAYMGRLIAKYRQGEFGDRDGWMCKIWFPEMLGRVIDSCVQLWGGSGWMDDNIISRIYTSARVQRIFAGATELQKSLMGRHYVSGG